jgi:rhomboid protease GluP
MGQMDQRRMCPHCRAFITSKDRICPYCNEKVGPRQVDARNPAAILGGFIPHAHFNTVVILVINLGMFLATALYSMNAGRGNAMGIDTLTLIQFGAKFDPYVFAGQWWRLVTAGFLHGGLFHIFMNLWVLFDLGAQVDEVYGSSRMLVIYFLANIFGYFASAVFTSAPSVGASAALFGLIGAMLALGVRHRGSAAGAAVRGMYTRWVVYGLLFSFLPGIDIYAHVGGLVAGFGVAYVAGQPRYEGSPTENWWRWGSWFCIFLTAACFLKMYLWFAHSAQ